MRIAIFTRCPFCGDINHASVDPMDWTKYTSGKYSVLSCFPYLSPDERELIITGICKECWSKL